VGARRDLSVPAALLAVGAALLIVRWLRARRHERLVAARLPLGDTGLVRGAEPIDLPHESDRAVLLLHGFGDTPQALAHLAAYLHARGWAVRAPLLPGHGRTLRAFAASRAEQWASAARSELTGLRTRYSKVAVVGLSMGGALATALAAGDAELHALALIAPYLEMPPALRRLAHGHQLFGALAAYVAGRGEASIQDPAERERSLAYGACTPRLLRELAAVVDRGTVALPSVRAPTLVIHSHTDHRIAPARAHRAFALLGACEKRLVWTERGGHVLTVDYGREQVLEQVGDWLEAHAGRGASEAGRGTAPATGTPPSDAGADSA
jgi:carboxylesterase